MLPTHRHVATHNGYEIYQRQPGFEFTPVTLGKIASFIVQGGDGSISVFAFMYSMLIALKGDAVQEDELLARAVVTVQEQIDAGRAGNHQELTFEYRHGDYVEANNPQWWIRSFE